MAEIQDAVRRRFEPCPTCERTDRVENVAVARERAVETIHTTDSGPPVFVGPDQPPIPGPVRRRSVTRPTPLGRRLSPAPLGTAGPFAMLGAFLGTVSAGFFYMDWAGTRDAADSVPYPSFPGAGAGVPNYLPGPTTAAQNSFPVAIPVVLAALCVAFVLLAVGIRVRRGPVRRGRAKAEEVSRLGWYCGRCGTVYFQPGRAPQGARDSTSYSLVEFRRLVFRAGGYEHLVDARSVR